MEGLIQDLRFGARLLRNNTGFTLVAMMTIALGVGANTSIFSVVDAMLFRPLPYVEPGRLFMLVGFDTRTSQSFGTTLLLDFLEMRSHHRGIEGPIVSQPAPPIFGSLLAGERPEDVQIEEVSAGFLQLLGVQPLLGRAFLSAEHEPGNEHVAILSHGFWQRRFGGDRGILGTNIRFEETTLQVIGVLPSNFVFPSNMDSPPEILVPLVFSSSDSANPQALIYRPIVRLKPNVTAEQAEAEVNSLLESVKERYPETSRTRADRLLNLRDGLFGHTRTILLLLFGAAGFVLLIACANIASLLLARGVTRQHELATRSVLGASRSRLIRQLLAESILLSALGGCMGFLISFWTFDLVRAQLPALVYTMMPMGIDKRVLLFSVAVSVLAGLIFGLLPACRFSQLRLSPALQQGNRGTTGSVRSFQLGNLMIISEIALSLVLLAGAGLMVNSFVRVRMVNLGFQPENVLTMFVTLTPKRYASSPRLVIFYQQLIERLRAVPGVLSLAGGPLPMSGETPYRDLRIEPGSIEKPVGVYLVTADYFRALGIRLLKGRTFSDRESFSDIPVAVVNESAARLLWPHEDPLGRSLKDEGEPAREIIGVVADARQSLMRPAIPAMYVPFDPLKFYGMAVIVRVAGNSAGLIRALPAQVWEMDKDLAVTVLPLEFYLAREIADRRFQTLLFSLFATMALFLTAIGIYGIVYYSVSRRTHEIGIRMALGAQATDLHRMVIREVLVPVISGISIGFGAALALTRLMVGLLYGITPQDPATLLFACLMIIAVAVTASYVPARRATHVDAMVALRHE